MMRYDRILLSLSFIHLDLERCDLTGRQTERRRERLKKRSGIEIDRTGRNVHMYIYLLSHNTFIEQTHRNRIVVGVVGDPYTRRFPPLLLLLPFFGMLYGS